MKPTSAARRVGTLAGVILAHALLLALLSRTGTIPPLLPLVLPIRMLPAAHPPPPPPPPIQPRLAEAPLLAVPPPEISLATPPPQPKAPRAITRAPAPAQDHFRPATDTGLGLDVATVSGGGAGLRGSLAGFEAAVRRQVLAAKRQPSLAWDRRQTCVVNYTVRVTPGGGLAGLSIDPCAIPEINAAAEAAIRAAAPFPPPPNLGASDSAVHGSLVFHP